MAIDLFLSRRNYNFRCLWWSRNEDNQYEEDELIMKRVPSGSFVAKEISSQARQEAVMAGNIMFDKETTTIKSPDNLSNIKANDLVLYQEEKWLVVSVQKSKAKMGNTHFAEDKNCSHFWYLELHK